MGVTHFDAGVVIGYLDADDAHHAGAREMLAAAVDSNRPLAIAASALAECLVGPARRGEAEIRIVLELMARIPFAVIDLDTAVATEAARLRARHRSLRLPDALVIATATLAEADVLVTTDRRWPDDEVLAADFEIRRI